MFIHYYEQNVYLKINIDMNPPEIVIVLLYKNSFFKYKLEKAVFLCSVVFLCENLLSLYLI